MSSNSQSRQPPTAAQILQRLPIHRSLTDAQTILVELTPVLQAWLSYAVEQRIISKHCAETTTLEAWQSKTNSTTSPTQSMGKLTISCATSSAANQLKHCQQSMTDFLNKQLKRPPAPKPNDSCNTNLIIDKIAIKLRLSSAHDLRENPTSSTKKSPAHQPSKNSIAAIEACQKASRSEALANALKKLANTLRNSIS